MQYVRNQLITNAKTKEQIEDARVRTIGRKLQEMRYALAIEKKMSKQQILEGYLNVSYFGAGAYGVEAAARRYFDVSASQVTPHRQRLSQGWFSSQSATTRRHTRRSGRFAATWSSTAWRIRATSPPPRLRPPRRFRSRRPEAQGTRERLRPKQVPVLLRLHHQPDQE